MPVLRSKDGFEKSVSNPTTAAALVNTGEWKYANPEDAKSIVTTDDVTGLTQRTPTEDFNLDTSAGQQRVSPTASGTLAAESADAYTEDQYSGAAQNVKGAAEGFGSIASFGGSDALLSLAGADTAGRAEHTAGRKVGEIAGIAGTIAAPFLGAGAGAVGAAGLLSKAAAGAKTVAGRVGLAGLEGSAMMAGNVLSEVALSDPGLSAESLAAHAGDFAHAALLGGALGFTGGVVGEGVAAIGGRIAARSPKAEFASGAGKEATETLARTYQTVESIATGVGDATKAVRVGEAAAEILPLHQAIRAATKVSDELVTPLSNLRATIGEMVANGSVDSRIAGDLLKEYNRVATKIPGASRTSMAKGFEQLLEDTDSLIAKASLGDSKLEDLAVKLAEAPSDKLVKRYLSRARETIGDLQHPELIKAVEDLSTKVDDMLKPLKFNRTGLDEALIVKPGERVTANSMRRMLEQPDGWKRAVRTVEYYDEVGKAAAAHPTLKLQYDDALKQWYGAMDNILSPEAAKALTPQAIATILGGGAAAELLDKAVDLPEPLHRMLQLAALYKGLGGIGGMKLRAGSFFRRIARTAARRGAGAMAARETYKAVSDVAGETVGAGMAGAAYSAAGWLTERAAAKLAATKVVANTTNSTVQEIEASVKALTKGKKPAGKLRVLPGVNKVMDKLLGPEKSKGKNEQEKFKLIQDNLARFNASPQSAMDGIYHALKPVQEANEVVADMLETSYASHFEHAFETMPKDPGTMISFGKSMWQPTDRQLYEWGYSLLGSLYPLEVVGAIASGSVPPQAVEALAATNPAIFNEFVRNVMENSEAIRENATYDQKIALGLALQMPLEPTTDPQYVAFIQNTHVEATMAAAAGPTKETSSAEDDYSQAQKLLS